MKEKIDLIDKSSPIFGPRRNSHQNKQLKKIDPYELCKKRNSSGDHKEKQMMQINVL